MLKRYNHYRGTVAAGMLTWTLQFSPMQTDHSRPLTLPLKMRGHQVLNGLSMWQTAHQLQTNKDGGDHQRGKMELFHEDSSRTKHTTGTGFAASGAHRAMELCDPTSLPKKSVERQHSGLTVVCWGGRKYHPRPSSSSPPCWSRARTSESAKCRTLYATDLLKWCSRWAWQNYPSLLNSTLEPLRLHPPNPNCHKTTTTDREISQMFPNTRRTRGIVSKLNEICQFQGFTVVT